MSHHTTAMHPTTTTTATTGPKAAASVPPSRYWAALAAALFVLVAAVVTAAVMDTPYATLSPGKARGTVAAVAVDGAPTYPTDGDILFLTVGVDGDVSLLEAAAGWADPDVEVLAREAVFGEGVSTEENRRLNAAAMVGSKNVAVTVALTRLGIPLNPTGTGAVVLSVEPGTPAAGVLDVSDTIVAVDGVPVRTFEDLGPTVSERAPGTEVRLTVEPLDGEAHDVVLVLAPRPDDPARGFLGITGDTRDFDPGLPFGVDIDSGTVGGPSAGLAFALAVLDVLSEGSLTGGRSVAVTGTIDEAGNVGPVGGVAQKAAAAADAGAEILLVPSDELAEALAHDHGLEIHAVDTLDEALAALAAAGGDPLPTVA